MAACHMNENLFCGIVYIFTLQTFTDTSETVLNIQVLLKILGEILRYQMKLKKHLAFRSVNNENMCNLEFPCNKFTPTYFI